MKKIILMGLLSGISTFGFTQSVSNKSMNLTANVKAGCLVQAEDFSFGEIIQKNSTIANLSLVKNINLQCSKDSVITISQSGKINKAFAGYSANFVTLNNTGLLNDNEGYFPYFIKTTLLNTNANFVVVYKHFNKNLGLPTFNGQSYAVQVKTLTKESISLPLVVELNPEALSYTKRAGIYGDTVSYLLSF